MTATNKSALRVCVLLSGTGRSLENLLEWQARGELDCEFVGVISSRANVRGLEIAAAADLPTMTLSPKSFPDNAQFSAELATQVLNLEPDLVVLAGFMSFFELPDTLRGKVINVHPSLLPSFGGKGYYGHHVHEAAIAKGVRISGCTVHFVDNVYDNGPIILQRACPVLPQDDAETLAKRVFAEECKALPSAIQWIATGQAWFDDGIVCYHDALSDELT